MFYILLIQSKNILCLNLLHLIILNKNFNGRYNVKEKKIPIAIIGNGWENIKLNWNIDKAAIIIAILNAGTK